MSLAKLKEENKNGMIITWDNYGIQIPIMDELQGHCLPFMTELYVF